MKCKFAVTSVAVVVLLAGAAIAVFRQPAVVKAQDQTPRSIPDRISFGSVGITSGQTLRVSVANTIMPNDPNLPPGPSRVVITFRYPNGNLVRDYKTGDVIRKTADLARGDGTFLDLDYDRLPPSPIRVQIRPVVVVIPPPTNDANQDEIRSESAATTIELVNNASGRSQLVIFNHPAVLRGFNPQPDPPRPQ